MPAEFERHAATWLCWPHNAETWPGCLEQAEREFAVLVETLAESEPVHVLVQDESHAERVAARLNVFAALHQVESDDSWMRDIGPTFVREPDGELLALDWTFNSWGGKYPPWLRDDAVAGRVAELAGVPSLRPGLVLEGGALEVDGEGTLLAVESSLLGAARNPDWTREALERRLGELLGVEQVVWLEASLAGDDTDGHVDNIARFVAPGCVVCACEPDASDPNHTSLADCQERLRAAHDARGRRLELVELPMPPAQHADGERLPASYANFYIANRVVLVPEFGAPSDRDALERLTKLFPERRVVGVPARTLLRGLGTLHCLTQQQPA